MSRSATPLLRELIPANRVAQVLVPFLTLVAMIVGLLALHSLGSTAHSHSSGTGITNSVTDSHDHTHTADHTHPADQANAADQAHTNASASHDHDSITDQAAAAEAVPSIGPSGLTIPACPEGGGIECCVAAAACVMVLALLSVSIAIGGGPASLIVVVTLLALVAAFSPRVAPVRPPSLAQLATFRI